MPLAPRPLSVVFTPTWLAALAAVALSACLGMSDETMHTPPKGSSTKDLTSFVLKAADNTGLSADIAATIGATSVTLTVPHGVDLTKLKATVADTGASLSPSSGTAQDFTNPVNYTVTAEDGSSKTYGVTITVAASTSKTITQFQVLGINAAIDGTNISVTVPNGTDVTAIAPTLTTTGASVSPASGAPQNFTHPVQYTVTAADSSTQVYTATVSVAASASKDITSFVINGVHGAIAGNTITLNLPVGTDASSLTPSIVHTGASISPASGAAQNFSGPVTYTVTAADSSTRQYTVSVSVTQPVNLGSATITDGSAGDVANWAQTATITAVNFNGDAVEIDFDKKDGANRWADECDLPGFSPDCLQYTIWIFEYVGGQWYGTGAIEMWYGRPDTGGGTSASDLTIEQQIPQNWVYYSGVMSTHVLTPGETVGFMVTTGDERRKNNADFQERSNVFLVTLP
jgi:hypothetical protein